MFCGAQDSPEPTGTLGPDASQTHQPASARIGPQEVGVSPSQALPDPLPGVRQQLLAEYGETVPTEQIDRAAQEAVAELSDAPIREFVPVLAWRRARARLRRRAL
jgi:hypothetical protein